MPQPQMPAFASKQSDRWSADGVTPWGVLDMALRGNEAQWWELYHRAQADRELRALLRRMLPMADPDLAGGARLWKELLDRMAAAEDE